MDLLRGYIVVMVRDQSCKLYMFDAVLFYIKRIENRLNTQFICSSNKQLQAAAAAVELHTERQQLIVVEAREEKKLRLAWIWLHPRHCITYSYGVYYLSTPTCVQVTDMTFFSFFSFFSPTLHIVTAGYGKYLGIYITQIAIGKKWDFKIFKIIYILSAIQSVGYSLLTARRYRIHNLPI